MILPDNTYPNSSPSCGISSGREYFGFIVTTDRCELTKGYISQLENDLTSPSISTLIDILSALGTDAQTFFKDDKEEQVSLNQKFSFIKQNEYNIS